MHRQQSSRAFALALASLVSFVVACGSGGGTKAGIGGTGDDGGNGSSGSGTGSSGGSSGSAGTGSSSGGGDDGSSPPPSGDGGMTTVGCGTCPPPPANNRVNFNFNYGWKFIEMDVAGASAPTFNDSAWASVSLPHTFNDVDMWVDWVAFATDMPVARTYRGLS